MVRAVLFDLDGTLLDTRESILQSFEYTFRAHGRGGVTRADIVALVGQPLEEIYKALLPEVDSAVLSGMHRDWQMKNLHLYVAYPGAADTLDALRARGCKTAAVSTRKETVEVSLEEAGLVGLFDAVVTGDTTAKVKPDPESLYAALRLLRVEASQAVMVGDTEADIGAGKNAGMVTIGVTHGFRSREELLPHGADYLIDSVPDLLSILEKMD